MNRKIWKMLLVTILGLSLYTAAFGHGGQIRGPADMVPPNLGPGSPQPPSVGLGPTAPGPAGPSVKPPTNPAAGMTRTALTRNSQVARTGDGKKRTTPDAGYQRWEFWWECNKDAFLNLKERLDYQGNISGSGGFLAGRGRRDRAIATRRPSPDTIQNQIIPCLKQALKVDNADMLDSAVLSLARITRSE
ncbi:MAG: hypothetical protein ACYTG7_24560, partial [Planctomycetota bacterium]